MSALAVTLTVDELRELVEKSVDRALAKRGTPGDDPWMRPEEAAKVLGCCVESLKRWTKTRGLPGHKNGRDWRFKRSEIDAWMANAHGKGT